MARIGNRIALLLSLLFAALALTAIGGLAMDLAHEANWTFFAGQVVFAVCFTVMALAGIAYLVARQGELGRRVIDPLDTSQDADFSDPATSPRLSILIPSYKEDPAVVRRTLLSAALQRIAGREVVLLIDDPPQPRDPDERTSLRQTRELVGQMRKVFDPLAERISAAQARFDQMRVVDPSGLNAGRELFVECCDAAIEWLGCEISHSSTDDHADRCLIEHVLEPERSRLRGLRNRFAERRMVVATGGAVPDATDLRNAFTQLLCSFRVDFSSFERKRYEGLSHEPNKAMNLNSYIDLMGRHFVESAGAGGRLLVPSPPESATRHFRDADLVLTLDADSILVPDYAQRLAAIMLKPGHERFAVVQTPYSAFPNAPGLLERMAGAQTDVQYLVHQGFTAYGATFWVGANALLRMAALRDIVTYPLDGGVRFAKYIHDRTVIEDTESSIDLVSRGWQLYNHHQRLAFSATPPDFGSLLIQRRRWANGGLIILPKALRYLSRGPMTMSKCIEALLRVHYLTSVALVNVAFLLMLFGPFERNLKIVWIPLAMMPAMLAYAIDLVHCGYRWRDLIHVYALNLVLVPVSLGGTARSIYQMASGRRSAFGRTPKVAGRTAANGAYLTAELTFLGLCVMLSVFKFHDGKFLEAVLVSLNLSMLAYGLARYVGLRNGVTDLHLWLGLAGRSARARTAETPMAGYGINTGLSALPPDESSEAVAELRTGTTGDTTVSRVDALQKP